MKKADKPRKPGAPHAQPKNPAEPVIDDMLTPQELELLRKNGNEARAFGIKEFKLKE